VEEHTRKLKELVISCVRVALKDPNKVVDEQTKDFWKWRDTIIMNEDQLLEVLCFDLHLESPYRILYDLLKEMNVHHNKRLRDAAWAFINDTNMTQACLLFTARAIAGTALYFAASKVDQELPDGPDKQPWWKAHRVRLLDIQRAMNYMADFFENSATANGQNGNNPYGDMRTPLVGDDEDGSHKGSLDESPSRTPVAKSEGEVSPAEGSAKSDGKKREREDEPNANGDLKQTNGDIARLASRIPQPQSQPPLPPLPQSAQTPQERSPKRRKTNDSGSEEGEI
jgi:protein BUR2